MTTYCKTLSIDIETYSSEDLIKSGVYKYVEAPDFSILLFAYAFDDEDVEVIDLENNETIPQEVLEALQDPTVLKKAYNAQFERVCLGAIFGPTPPEQWECTMVKASMLGLPLGLDKVGEVLNIQDQKMKEGKDLIRYFCKPCKPTKTNGQRTRNLPHHEPERWDIFKRYCAGDVKAEREIAHKISFFNIPDQEKKLYTIDQKINDFGIQLDMTLVENAINMNNTYVDSLMQQMKNLTGLPNPNSTAQLKKWIEEEIGITVTSLAKGKIGSILEQSDSDLLRQVIKLKQEMSKTSVKKYEAMRKAIRSDGRVGGLLQFYGANRTGRWAGRLVQVQNLPQNKIPDLDLARNVVLEGDLELLELLYGNVPNILSQLVRTAFVASEGNRFIVADFSAIEARVIAWLAKEKWRMDVFATHGKIYEASASQMFKVPIEEIDKGSPLRQKGKVAELALGYQGGPNALITMGALDMGIEEEELKPIVDAWRKANPQIVKLWKTVQKLAIKAVKEKIPQTLPGTGITFSYARGIMSITLPSGRQLSYMRATVEPGDYGDRLVYEGMDQTTKKWQRVPTYGGKLVENIVQAVARDCLAVTLHRLADKGIQTVMHVHDEVIVDAPQELTLKAVTDEMDKPIEWAPGLELRGDGYETVYYLKD